MDIERVLAAFDEYFELKRNIRASSICHDGLPVVSEAKKRIGLALSELIDTHNQKYHSEQQRRASSDTQRIEIDAPADVFKITWNEIAVLLDALNCPPKPLEDNDRDKIDNWMKAYTLWYKRKRMGAIRSLTPPKGIPATDEPEFILEEDWNF